MAAGDSALLSERAAWALQQNDRDALVIAMNGPIDPTYSQLERLAAALAAGLERALPAGSPILIVTLQDVAKALGQLLRQKTGKRSVVTLDGIEIDSGQFIDFGVPILHGMAVPVIIKTLIFEKEQ